MHFCLKSLLAFRIRNAKQYWEERITYPLFPFLYFLYVITRYVLDRCGPKAELQIWYFLNYLGVQE